MSWGIGSGSIAQWSAALNVVAPPKPGVLDNEAARSVT
jgi:hypothetical protein